MRTDPEVTRLKFGQEVHRLNEQQSTLQSRGIFVVGAPTYPSIDLLFLPHHFLQVAVPARQSGTILLPQGAMAQLDVPSLAARAFKAHFDLTDYDIQPPSLEFRDVWTDEPLKYETMFRALEFEEHRKTQLVLLPEHPKTGRPFLCLRGVREYHEHPQHSGDDWLLYRKGMGLFSIAMSLWRVSLDLVHPRLVIQPGGLQVQWLAEERT